MLYNITFLTIAHTHNHHPPTTTHKTKKKKQKKHKRKKKQTKKNIHPHQIQNTPPPPPPPKKKKKKKKKINTIELICLMLAIFTHGQSDPCLTGILINEKMTQITWSSSA